MKIVAVSRMEFKLEDGRIFPIDPPLNEEMTPDEFQQHYDLAVTIVESIKVTGNNIKNAEAVGCSRDNQDSEKSW